MKTFSKLLTLAVLAMTSLTSCEDILGHWERPTAATDSTPTPTPDPTPTPASEDLATLLTLEAVSGTVTVTIKTDFATGKTIEYSTDDGATWTEGTPSLGGGADVDACANPVTITGSKIMLRGTNAAYGHGEPPSSYNCTKIECDADCYIYGNMMSLINKDNFATLTAFDTTEGGYAFYRLFDGNTHIKNHSEKKLLLPATTLTSDCYHSLFSGCTSLTTAPELTATTMQPQCYRGMFYNCIALTQAPQLPAENLNNGCYQEMFNGCTALTTAPELPATTLEPGCYRSMFAGCTLLTTAPELPATTLMPFSYYQMFQNCINLNSVTCYATDINAMDCLTNWLDGVAATGTIKTKATMSIGSWTAGTNYPTGWTHDTSL